MQCAALWCVMTHICALVSVVAVVQDQKANRALATLYLHNNDVGDAGAAALAEALKATVLTCEKCVFRARVRCHRKCCFTESSEELGVNLLCIVRCGFCVFLWFEGKCLFISGSQELRAGCSQVDVAQCQNQTGLIEF